MISRRNFIKDLGTAAIVISSGYGIFCNKKQKTRPNILFIMSDDHAAHAISAYQSRINQTPNIDRIARDGMRFNNCFCTNSICAPSRAVILTGKYSHLNGVIDNGQKFDGAQLTFPKLLKQKGYEIAIVGKWHLKSDPTGFDYWNVLPGQGAYSDPILIENGKRREHSGYVTDIITDIALNWLKNRSTENPFCLMLHHKAPHADWIPDRKHARMYAETKIPESQTFNDDYVSRCDQIKNHRLKVGIKQWELHFQHRFGEMPQGMNEQEVREWVYQRYMKDYLRCIASVDDNVGRILDYLEESGLSNNTVVIYTSDQGFFLGDHGLYDKRFMYEHSLRMPFLIKYPEEIKKSTQSSSMILNLDFAPTILDYAGISIPDEMQGKSFRAIARGINPQDWRELMYYRFYENGFGVGPMEGIRTINHKLIHYLYGNECWELFDLQNDPDELQNLYFNPKHKMLIEELKAKMQILKMNYELGKIQ